MGGMTFDKDIRVPKPDSALKDQIIGYLRERGFDAALQPDGAIRGRRGSWLGNATSFDMRRVIAEIRVSDTHSGGYQCTLEVNTLLQYITPSNRFYFQYELDTLESFLLRGDDHSRDWKTMDASARKEALATIFVLVASFGLAIGVANLLLRLR